MTVKMDQIAILKSAGNAVGKFDALPFKAIRKLTFYFSEYTIFVIYAFMSYYSKSEDCPIFESCDLSHVQWSGETGICIPQKCE